MTASRPSDPFAARRATHPSGAGTLEAFIRAVTLADAEALRAFKRQALAETEYLLQGLEDFDDRSDAETETVARFQQQPNCLLLVAVQPGPDGRTAGLGAVSRFYRPKQPNAQTGHDGSRIVGLASVVGGHLHRTRHVGTMSVAVLQQCWRRGIATRLMRAAVEWARTGGELQKLTLQVHASNVPAWALYRSLGFVEEGRLRGEARVGPGFDDLVPMGLWLHGAPPPLPPRRGGPQEV